MKVRCYGGPLHREFLELESGTRRIAAAVRDRHKCIGLFSESRCNPVFREVSYEIDWWYESRGNATRKMRVAVLEGSKNLLTHEQQDIAHDLSEVSWVPKVNPSILYDFENWWSWCMYRIDNDPRNLSKEFHK